jgi:hypothetical protein
MKPRTPTTQWTTLAFWSLALLLLGGLLLAVPPAEAQTKTLRGQILRHTSSSTYPLRSAAVRLKTANGQRSNVVYTNEKGHFYFYNIPSGRYTLEIHVRGQKNPFLRSIHVPAKTSAHDLRAIKLSF